MVPPAAEPRRTPQEAAEGLAARFGESEAARRCAALLAGADPREDLELVRGLLNVDVEAALNGTWGPAYWFRVWGARALLYLWDDAAAPTVLDRLVDPDEAWRVREMCLKVSAKREIGEAGPAAAGLVDHELSRVRTAAMRTLGAVGDTEHVAVVRAARDDPDPEVRRCATRALLGLRDRLDLP